MYSPLPYFSTCYSNNRKQCTAFYRRLRLAGNRNELRCCRADENSLVIKNAGFAKEDGFARPETTAFRPEAAADHWLKICDLQVDRSSIAGGKDHGDAATPQAESAIEARTPPWTTLLQKTGLHGGLKYRFPRQQLFELQAKGFTAGHCFGHKLL